MNHSKTFEYIPKQSKNCYLFGYAFNEDDIVSIFEFNPKKEKKLSQSEKI